MRAPMPVQRITNKIKWIEILLTVSLMRCIMPFHHKKDQAPDSEK